MVVTNLYCGHKLLFNRNAPRKHTVVWCPKCEKTQAVKHNSKQSRAKLASASQTS